MASLKSELKVLKNLKVVRSRKGKLSLEKALSRDKKLIEKVYLPLLDQYDKFGGEFDYEKTAYYLRRKYYLKLAYLRSKKRTYWNLGKPKKLRARVDEFLDLYESVKSKGFLHCEEDPIEFIDLGDRYYRVTGKHRLSIALKLGIKEIPCIIHEVSSN